MRHICGGGRVRCTRNVAVVYSRRINAGDGSPIDTLTIYDNEEPAAGCTGEAGRTASPSASQRTSWTPCVCGSDMTFSTI